MYRFDDVRLTFEPGTADDIAARVVAIDVTTGRHAEGTFVLPLDADDLAADGLGRGPAAIRRGRARRSRPLARSPMRRSRGRPIRPTACCSTARSASSTDERSIGSTTRPSAASG